MTDDIIDKKPKKIYLVEKDHNLVKVLKENIKKIKK